MSMINSQNNKLPVSTHVIIDLCGEINHNHIQIAHLYVKGLKYSTSALSLKLQGEGSEWFIVRGGKRVEVHCESSRYINFGNEVGQIASMGQIHDFFR